MFTDFRERERNIPYVPQPGMEPAAFWCTGRCSTRLKQPGRAYTAFYMSQVTLTMSLGGGGDYYYLSYVIQERPTVWRSGLLKCHPSVNDGAMTANPYLSTNTVYLCAFFILCFSSVSSRKQCVLQKLAR